MGSQVFANAGRVPSGSGFQPVSFEQGRCLCHAPGFPRECLTLLAGRTR